ncbi:hypothetical protein BHE74_00008920 [Ensete ventricosum]|nr:hypothetical protein GW17_00014852 [Ensete ventricosum]RWW82599.1 hypothetical protein BHE74_00008920 [Ensete ventricosum]
MAPYRAVRTGRYGQLIGTLIARHRAIPLKSTIDGRLREKEGEEEEGEKYLARAALPWFPHAVCRRRVKNRPRDPSPTSDSLPVGDYFSPRGETKCLPVPGEGLRRPPLSETDAALMDH